MTKAIIFDCFGVLTHSAWKDFWVSLPSGNLQEKAKKLNQAYYTAVINREKFSNQLQALTGKSRTEIDNKLFDQQPIKNYQLIDYIKTLKPHYKVSILSNIASNWIEERLLSSEEKLLFDDILLSYEAGVAKPDPQIYYLAAKRLNLNVNECVLIDDNEQYCIAAREIGMKAILYKSLEQMKIDLQKIID